jgi:outer membrane protein TolC
MGPRAPPVAGRAGAFHVASADDLESAKLAVAAEVADDYFALRTLDDEFALVAGTVEADRRSLELTQNRRRGGIVSDLDVAQAATQLHTAETGLPDIRIAAATRCGTRSP